MRGSLGRQRPISWLLVHPGIPGSNRRSAPGALQAGVRHARTAEVTGRCAVDAFEQPVEMRDIPKARGECYVCDGPLGLDQQIADARGDAPVVDMLADRTAGRCKQLVDVALRATKRSRQCGRGEIAFAAAMLDVVQHHRHQYGSIQPPGRSFLDRARRMAHQIDDVRTACRQQDVRYLRGEAEFCVAGKRSRKCPADFRGGQRQPWPFEEAAWQKLSGNRKAEQFEVSTIGDLERLRGIHYCKIARSADLLVTALRVPADSSQLEVYEAQIVAASRDMRGKPENRVFARGDAGHRYRVSVGSRDRSLKRLIGYLARLEPNECGGQIVSPGAKALIGPRWFRRPFHDACQRLLGGQAATIGSLIRARQGDVVTPDTLRHGGESAAASA